MPAPIYANASGNIGPLHRWWLQQWIQSLRDTSSTGENRTRHTWSKPCMMDLFVLTECSPRWEKSCNRATYGAAGSMSNAPRYRLADSTLKHSRHQLVF